jgi:predicted metal-dependent hydrolase
VEELDQGQYRHCSETLHGVWLRENYPVRLFYHGLIKAAVGLLHLERRNRHGALVKLQDAANALIPFLPQFMGIDTQKLRGDLMDRVGLLKVEGLVDWKAIPELPPVQINSHCH